MGKHNKIENQVETDKPSNKDKPDNSPPDHEKLVQKLISRLPGGVWCLVFIGLVALIASFGKNLKEIAGWILIGWNKIDMREMPAKPYVIMLTPTSPEGHFGVLHKKGLISGLSPTRFGSPVIIGGHKDEFKKGKLDNQLTELRKQLEKGDVVALVAPSITEAAEEVLEVVSQVEPSIPVIIESSVPWESLYRFRDGPPLFRLSSGIGERGREIGYMTMQLEQQGLKVWLLIEEVPNEPSYGLLMHDHIIRTDGGKTIPPDHRVLFPTGNPLPKLSMIPFDDPHVVVFALCLGTDFITILRSLYDKAKPTQARIVGVMTAHLLPDLIDSKHYKHHLIFDISDLDTRPGISRNPAAQLFFNRYATQWGDIEPTHRDQAFSFDAALLMDSAFSDELFGMRYIEGLNAFSTRMSRAEIIGVTGRVKFVNPRPDMKKAWQNDQPKLQVVSYNPLKPKGQRWFEVRWRAWK